MPPFIHSRRAFTMFEIMVVIGIGVILLGTGLMFLTGNKNSLRARQTTATVTALIRSAQSNARGQIENTRWGVHIDNTLATSARYSQFMVDEGLLADPLFTGIPGTTTDQFSLPHIITVVNPPEGETMRIIFNKGTGLPVNATSVIMQVDTDASSQETITIDENGRIAS